MSDKSHFMTKGTTAVAIAAIGGSISSCSHEEADDLQPNERLYHEVPNSRNGEPLMRIDSISMSAKFEQVSKGVVMLTREILQDKTSSDRFAISPEKFIEEYFSNKPEFEDISQSLLSLPAEDLALLKAFTDSELKSAMEADDLHAFFDIAIRKGYLPNSIKPLKADSLKSYFNTEADYKNFNSYINALDIIYDYSGTNNCVLEDAGIFIIALAAVGVAIAIGVFFYYDVHCKTKVTGLKWIQNNVQIMDYLPMMTTWIRHNPFGRIDMEDKSNEIIDRVNFITNSVKDFYPELNQDAVKEVLMLNMTERYN